MVLHPWRKSSLQLHRMGCRSPRLPYLAALAAWHRHGSRCVLNWQQVQQSLYPLYHPTCLAQVFSIGGPSFQWWASTCAWRLRSLSSTHCQSDFDVLQFQLLCGQPWPLQWRKLNRPVLYNRCQPSPYVGSPNYLRFEIPSASTRELKQRCNEPQMGAALVKHQVEHYLSLLWPPPHLQKANMAALAKADLCKKLGFCLHPLSAAAWLQALSGNRKPSGNWRRNTFSPRLPNPVAETHFAPPPSCLEQEVQNHKLWARGGEILRYHQLDPRTRLS